MYIDPVLKEKWIVQQRLTKKANYNVDNLAKNAHLDVLELTEKSKIHLKYSKMQGGYIKKVSSI